MPADVNITPVVGRFAPSPSGEFHIGNLRTALLAWALARKCGGGFVLRMEDLDARCRPEYASAQLRDLEALGLDWDGQVLYQSRRIDLYEQAFAQLAASDKVYECYCSRRELAQLASAPHAKLGHYPGVCRQLTDEARWLARRRLNEAHRGWAQRLRADVATWPVTDMFYGEFSGEVDDFVLRRSDGVFSYNFTVVFDDLAQGVNQVCRGRDLLDSSARQNYLRWVLDETGLAGTGKDNDILYAHVPLVLSPRGSRLAKRDGAVSASALQALGYTWGDIIRLITGSVLDHPVDTAREFLKYFNPMQLRRQDWVFNPPA